MPQTTRLEFFRVIPVYTAPTMPRRSLGTKKIGQMPPRADEARTDEFQGGKFSRIPEELSGLAGNIKLILVKFMADF